MALGVIAHTYSTLGKLGTINVFQNRENRTRRTKGAIGIRGIGALVSAAGSYVAPIPIGYSINSDPNQSVDNVDNSISTTVNANVSLPSNIAPQQVTANSGIKNNMALGLTCPTNQTPTTMYDGSVKCCGGPAASDPCGILNNVNFLAAQSADVGPINPSTGVPISAGTGSGAAELAMVAGYPQNVQTDAIDCWNNPGLVFTDNSGMTVNCPSASINDNGIYVSAYSAGTLAQMLAPTVTPSVITVGNAPNVLTSFAAVTAAGSVSQLPNSNPYSLVPANAAPNTINTMVSGGGTPVNSTTPLVDTNGNVSGTLATTANTTVDAITGFFSGLSMDEILLGGAAIIGLFFILGKK
jgi:hypothetical protein